MANYSKILTLILSFSLSSVCYGQQAPDTLFNYSLKRPAYEKGTGPVVTLDEAHLNFHKLKGRYYAFGNVLKKDGYVLKSGNERFTLPYLSKTKILVIANALADSGEWKLPAKSAFSREEISAVNEWVKQGGNLFLIADHMPFPGTNAELALSFGLNFIDGFAMRKDGRRESFSRKAGNLTANIITNGKDASERIDSVMFFTGQGFLPPPNATRITELKDDYKILLPSVAWEFKKETPVIAGHGLVNGCYLEYGKGRIVVFGEAAMFSAQLQGPAQNKMGMSDPRAKQNPQLLLNIIHWLDRKL